MNYLAETGRDGILYERYTLAIDILHSTHSLHEESTLAIGKAIESLESMARECRHGRDHAGLER